jgi:hypothetical protein
MSTILAILAVDFRVFPRRLAKAESHGVGMLTAYNSCMYCFAFQSIVLINRPNACKAFNKLFQRRNYVCSMRVSALLLCTVLQKLLLLKAVGIRCHKICFTGYVCVSGLMDFGSAAFVYISGLLPPARGFQSMFRTLVTSWPLAVLAAGRLIAVKQFQYPEHTSEYGVHWNFFATLLCLRIVVLLIRQLRRKMHIASSSVTAAVVTAASLLIVYQYALQHGLEGYILNAPRGTSLLADNRYTHERTSLDT